MNGVYVDQLIMLQRRYTLQMNCRTCKKVPNPVYAVVINANVREIPWLDLLK